MPRTTVMDAHLHGQILETDDDGRVSVIMDDEAYEQMELIAAKQNLNLKDSCLGEEIFSLRKKSFLDWLDCLNYLPFEQPHPKS